MSRDLVAEEKPRFTKMYGIGAKCSKCADPNVTIRIWERYGAGANKAGGDISPTGIVGAVIICEQCGHGQVLPRTEILKAS